MEMDSLHNQPVSLSLNVRGLGQSATLAIKDRCRALRRQGRNVYDFGLGQSPFPVPRSVVEALRTSAAEKDYLPVRGLPALREAVADFHRNLDHVETHSDRVIVGPGSKELMFLLQLVFYGEILIPTPCWVSHLPQARIVGRPVTLIPTSLENQWKLTPEQLVRTVEVVNDDHRPRLLILNSPSNPTSVAYTSDELQAIAEVARRFRIIVMSDEIYGQLHHTGDHVSIAQFYPEATIISSGLSKWCGAGGWRLGTFVFPTNLGWLADVMTAVASETYTSLCAPIQYAAVVAFQENKEIDAYLRHARRILAALGNRSVAILREAGAAVQPGDGAYYLFPDFSPLRDPLAKRGIYDDVALCRRLLDETGTAILPGSAFARLRSELTARLSLVDFNGAEALSASEALGLNKPLPADFVDRLCPNSIQGMKAIAAWLHASEM